MSLVEQLHAERKARLARMESGGKTPGMVSAEQFNVLEAKFFKARAEIAELEEMLIAQRKELQQYANKDGAPTISDVVIVVARDFNVPHQAIMGKGQSQDVTYPRHVAAYLCRRFGYSFPQIGDAFGRDHTTIISGCSQIERRAQSQNYVAYLVRLENEVSEYASGRAARGVRSV